MNAELYLEPHSLILLIEVNPWTDGTDLIILIKKQLYTLSWFYHNVECNINVHLSLGKIW